MKWSGRTTIEQGASSVSTRSLTLAVMQVRGRVVEENDWPPQPDFSQSG
jgi:hypothetical protein